MKRIRMAKVFDSYSLTINGHDNFSFNWPVICRKTNIFCVKTEIGNLWLEIASKFSSEFVVININQFDDYLKWLDYQLRYSNLFVEVTEVENALLAHTKMGTFTFKRIANDWDDAQDKWVEVGRDIKSRDFARSHLNILSDGRLTMPYWVLKKSLSATNDLPIVRELTLLGLGNLLQGKVTA